MSASRKSYRVPWLFPVDAEPIQNATIEIEDARISAIHASYDPQAVQLGNVAIIPGLVNAHSHLEFSDLSDPLKPAAPFTDWIRALISHRKDRAMPVTISAAQGFREAAESGTSLLGEIATEGWSAEAFRGVGPRMVCFRELIALENSQFAKQLSIARRHLAGEFCSLKPGRHRTNRLGRLGISPHAPYSVHPDLFHQLVDLANEFDSPLAIHLAETEAELELLDRGSGLLVDLLTDFGLWQEGLIPRNRAPLDYLMPLADLSRALVIHGNYLGEPEFAFLAEHPQLTVVYCPRTHDYFGHSDHPWLHMLNRSVSLALGTDSRASNPDLSLWREIKFLSAHHPEVDPRVLLELGTIRGARALGFEEDTGSLTVGKLADLAVVSLAGGSRTDPYLDLFHSLGEVVRTMCGGRWISDARPR